MKTNTVIGAIGLVIVIAALAAMAWFMPYKRVQIGYTATVGSIYKEVTYQNRNIFGINIGDEYVIYDAK